MLLNIHAHRFEDDRKSESAGDRDDERKSRTVVEQQLHSGDRSVVDGGRADRQKKGDRMIPERRP